MNNVSVCQGLKVLISNLARVGILIIIFNEDAVPLECSSYLSQLKLLLSTII